MSESNTSNLGTASADASQNHSRDQLLDKDGQPASRGQPNQSNAASPPPPPIPPQPAVNEKSAWGKYTSKKRYWFAALAFLLVVLGLSLGLGLGLGLKKDKQACTPSSGSSSNSNCTSSGDNGNTNTGEPHVIGADWAKSVPYYPAPRGGWSSDWVESYRKAAIMVNKMSLLEKVNITTGVGWSMGPCVGNTGTTSVGFPQLCLQDGPLGLRFADYITVFPPGVTTAATWSKKLMLDRATAMGKEARAKGVNILLGPCMGPLGRSPTGGRNWEGFGSDPYLQGVAGSLSVRGIQSQGVIATMKHWVGNEQERFRQAGEAAIDGFPNATESISSNIGERALRELYAWPFAEAMRESPGAAMCSYNQINNSYACQNSYIMNGVLKDELGFQGFVMSDWLAQHSGVGATLAGMDMTMPGDGAGWANGQSFWGSELTQSVINGTVPEYRLNDMVLRVVAAWYKMGQDQNFPNVSFTSWTKNTDGFVYQGTGGGPVKPLNLHIDARSDHYTVAHDVAAEAITLLKNFNNSLPLSNSSLPISILLFGSDAGPNPIGPNGCPDRNCNQGTLGQGWGSGAADYSYVITPLEIIQARALAVKGRRPAVQYTLDDTNLGYADGLAQTPGSKCFVFVSSDAGEGFTQAEGTEGDRNDLNLWHGGDELILTVAGRCNDTVVIIHSVGPVVMEQWIDHENVTAVLMAHLPSSESGSSLSNVLFGDINPSGHLPYTIGKRLEDYGPTADIMRTPNHWTPQEDFSEDLNIDYRYFDAKNITPRFDFGFGLSYTTFHYKNITIKQVEGEIGRAPPSPPEPRADVPTIKSNIPSIMAALVPDNFTILNKYVYPYLTAIFDVNSTATYPYPEGYSNESHALLPGSGGQGGNPTLFDTLFQVEVNITNTGKTAGQTVPQLYVTFPIGIQEYTPPRQLRGFEKIGVGINETVTVTFDVRRRDISVWDESKPPGEGEGWYIPSVEGMKVGEGFTFWVGQSSRGQGIGAVTVVN